MARLSAFLRRYGANVVRMCTSGRSTRSRRARHIPVMFRAVGWLFDSNNLDEITTIRRRKATRSQGAADGSQSMALFEASMSFPGLA